MKTIHQVMMEVNLKRQSSLAKKARKAEQSAAVRKSIHEQKEKISMARTGMTLSERQAQSAKRRKTFSKGIERMSKNFASSKGGKQRNIAADINSFRLF